MTIKVLTLHGWRTRSNVAPGPDALYLGLICATAWLPVTLFGSNPAFAMALATALTLCASLAYAAMRRVPSIWTPFTVWLVRSGAAATAGWLFLATPSANGRYGAVALFALAYVAGEAGIAHRLKSQS